MRRRRKCKRSDPGRRRTSPVNKKKRGDDGKRATCEASDGVEAIASTAASRATREETAAFAPGATSWKKDVASSDALRTAAGLLGGSSEVADAAAVGDEGTAMRG